MTQYLGSNISRFRVVVYYLHRLREIISGKEDIDFVRATQIRAQSNTASKWHVSLKTTRNILKEIACDFKEVNVIYLKVR